MKSKSKTVSILRRVLERVQAAGTPYEVLSIPPGANAETIKKAHLALVALLHPDRNPGDAECADAAARVNVARDTLQDPAERRKLDTLLHTEASACSRCKGTGKVHRQHGFARKVEAVCPACGGDGNSD